MAELDRRIVLLTTLLSTFAALLIAVVLPLNYYYFGYRYHAGYIAAEANAQSVVVETMIARNPRLWWFASDRIEDALDGIEAPQDGSAHEDRRRIFAGDGALVSEALDIPGRTPRLPVVRTSVDLHYNGITLGRLEIERSLRPLLYRSLGIGLFSALVGLCVFAALRALPLRELRRAWKRTSFLASHDVLTGLPNRALFMQLLERGLALARRRQGSLAVLCLDLDHFKDVNDTLGHAAGDLLLRQVAERVGGCIRDADTLARLGGDEFAILQTDVDQPGSASAMAERIIEKLAKPFDLDGHEALIGVSIGIALYAHPSQSPASMMRDADLSLYRAKSHGRGTFCFFEQEMNTRLELRKRTESELRQALDRNEFELHYQPQYAVEGGRMTGFEALLRWRHPQRGLVSPDEFLLIAEETGLIFPLGEWILRTACAAAVHWPGLAVAVNLSPVQFRRPGLDQLIAQVLRESGLPAHRLELEITERLLLQDTESTLAQLQAIKALGVAITMDDFGTGYSSLAYLRQFPFDKVKIDPTFVRDVDRVPASTAIVRAIVRLAHALGMSASAEGVENHAELDRLRAEGCDGAQGFHLGRPMPVSDVTPLIDKKPSTSRPPAA